MDSPLVPGMTPEHEDALRAAGIDSLPKLAAVEPKEASARTGIRATVLASYREAARERIQEILQKAGVTDLASLAGADVEELSARTGFWMATVEEYRDAALAELWGRFRAAGVGSPEALARHEDVVGLAQAADVPVYWVEHFRRAAREQYRQPTPASEAVPIAHEEPERAPAPEPARDPYAAFQPRAIDRIILDPSVPFARVVVRGAESWSVPVVALAREEDERAAAQRAGAYAVVLREGSPEGVAIVDGRMHAALPLYEQFASPARPGERLERRVRVSALREKK